ncbi:MAG: hypothetical protein EXR72_06500 [Myxococcales bacterium]|nr:hypothetical protein [Myxococcales bacterium]
MARGPKQARQDKRITSEGSDDAGTAKERPEIPTTFRTTLEEAWHGWMKSVAGLVLIVVAYVSYTQGWVPEGTAGLLCVAGIIGGAIAAAAMPVFEMLEKRQSKLLLGLFAAVWAIGAGYPSVRRALPARALADPVRIAYCASWKDPIEKRDCAESKLVATATLPENSDPYEIEVAGGLRGQGDASSNYHLEIEGAAGSKEDIEGTLERKLVPQRTSRRGSGTSIQKQEHTDAWHRLTIQGTPVKVTADGIDDALEEGLFLTFRSAGPDPRIFLGLAALCLLIGLFLDYRLAAPKVKTHFTVCAGITLVFAWLFPKEATPNHLVGPAVAYLAASASIGGIGGWILAAIVKSFKAEPKKMVK